MKSIERVVRGLLISAVMLVCADSQAIELRQTELGRDMHRVRFEGVAAMLTAPTVQFAAAETQNTENVSEEPFKMKSPLKAFLLSAAVPGAVSSILAVELSRRFSWARKPQSGGSISSIRATVMMLPPHTRPSIRSTGPG